jgi:predicted peptidase
MIVIMMRYFVFIFLSTLFLIFGFSKTLNAQSELFEKHIFKTDTLEMPYRLLKPQNYDSSKKYPLILFLHGAGERGTENEIPIKHLEKALLNPENRTEYSCFVLVPQCNKGFRWVEVAWNLDSHKQPEKISVYLQATVALLDSLQMILPIDSSKIYLTGLSMGGFGVWDLAMRQPKRFACIVPICGGGDETRAFLIKNIPIWAFHGALDKTVKTIRSRNMIATLKKLGSKPYYTEYPNIEHTSWKPAYSDKKMWKWMFLQKLK